MVVFKVNFISFYSKTNEMHQFLKFILFCNSTLHVSDGLYVHHQESKTVYTASCVCHKDSADCLLAGTRWNSFHWGHFGAESHLSGPPFHSTTSMFITATAHSPVLPHMEASTDAAFVLLIPHHTQFTVRYPPRTTSQGIITQ